MNWTQRDLPDVSGKLAQGFHGFYGFLPTHAKAQLVIPYVLYRKGLKKPLKVMKPLLTKFAHRQRVQQLNHIHRQRCRRFFRDANRPQGLSEVLVCMTVLLGQSSQSQSSAFPAAMNSAGAERRNQK